MTDRAGRLALEFLMTGGQTATRSGFEQLQDSNDLTLWLAATFRSDHGAHADATDLDAAVALREAIFSMIRRRTSGDAPNPTDVAILNAAAGPTPLVPRLDLSTLTATWIEPIHPVAALSTIARDAIDALSGPDGHRVRECANPNCELVFVDTSPPGARRWCAMRRCGNQSKTRSYRSRHAEAKGEGA